MFLQAKTSASRNLQRTKSGNAWLWDVNSETDGVCRSRYELTLQYWSYLQPDTKNSYRYWSTLFIRAMIHQNASTSKMELAKQNNKERWYNCLLSDQLLLFSMITFNVVLIILCLLLTNHGYHRSLFVLTLLLMSLSSKLGWLFTLRAKGCCLPTMLALNFVEIRTNFTRLWCRRA